MDGKRCAEPFNFLTNFSCGTATDSSIGLSWLDTARSIVSRGYLIKWSAVSLADISNLVDGPPKAKGANTQNIAKELQNCTATGQSPSTPHYLKSSLVRIREIFSMISW